MKPKKSPKKKTVAGARRVSAASELPAPTPKRRAPTKTRKTAVSAAPSVEEPVLKKAELPKAAPEEATPQKSASKTPARKRPLKIPSILLEGDKPTAPAVSGPGRRYALGPTAPVEPSASEGELPESYGTQQLLLAARDPHWLYAHWDLSREQQRRYNSLSRDKHLILRIYVESVSGRPTAEVHVHPESRHWFVHAVKAGTRYVATLGYYDAANNWTTVSTSSATLTPPDTISSDTSAEFTTIPIELPMTTLLSLVKAAVQETVPLAEALQELREQGHPELPAELPVPAAQWTPAQERALAAVISMDDVRRVWMGSLEITELIRRQVVQELASMAAAQPGGEFGAPTSPAEALGAISSPGRRERPKGFWFNVNAELIIYGATEPNASVTIGGRAIRLRPDGSFSFRFALPDGEYELPIVAVSADQTDGRAAELRFIRSTDFRGEVGAHPQDPALRKPEVESF